MLRHRLVVAAPTMQDVVRFAGGWLFDRVIAGWDVMVLTAVHNDARALRILGATAVDLESAMCSPMRGPRLQAVAVAADLYESDPRVRRRLLAAVDEGLGEVRIWDDRGSGGSDARDASMSYRPSRAARAFKAQAMMAASVPVDPDETVEVFHGVGTLHAYARV